MLMVIFFFSGGTETAISSNIYERSHGKKRIVPLYSHKRFTYFFRPSEHVHCETKPAAQKSSNKIFGPDLIFFFPTEAKKRWILLIWSKWEGKKIETFFPTPAKKLPMFELPPFNQWRKECSRLFHEQQTEMLNCWKYKYDVSNRLETNDTILLNSNLRVCVKIRRQFHNTIP